MRERRRGEPEPERQPRRVSAPPRRPDLSWRLPKIPSKTAKFHLQIVENRLEFQSKIVPLVDFSRRPCVAAAADQSEPKQQGVPATLPQPEPEPEPEPPRQPRARANERGLWLTGHVREQQRRSREGQGREGEKVASVT